MTTRVTAISADPWDLIPNAVAAFKKQHGRNPTRVRITRAHEEELDSTLKALPEAHGIRHARLREYKTVCGLTPEWDAERLEVR